MPFNVSSKSSSPLPVTVIASDDTRSVISGEFDSYAYVVATSSAPINDGDQVKLNEN